MQPNNPHAPTPIDVNQIIHRNPTGQTLNLQALKKPPKSIHRTLGTLKLVSTIKIHSDQTPTRQLNLATAFLSIKKLLFFQGFHIKHGTNNISHPTIATH